MRLSRRNLVGMLIGVLLALCGATAVFAQESPSTCLPGNLLTTARLTDSLDVVGSTRMVVDSAVVAEGADWTPAVGARFLTVAGSLTYDLGSRVRIASAYVQADAHNTFSLQISDDGKTFREIWRVPLASGLGRGMRSRSVMLWDEHARFVRFGEVTGNGSYTLSELQVFCKIPADWPPQLAAASAAKAPPAKRPFRLTRRHTDAAKLALALVGAMVLGLGYFLKRRGTPNRFKRLRDVLLILLGILGYTGYYNWGEYHVPKRVHTYEFFHYYVGSKYFPELGYTGLYECANLAEAEQGFRRRVELRKIRDLRKNELVPARYVLEDSVRLKRGFTRPFTPERWEAFKHDVAYFRDRDGIEAWERMVQDNGYNPSPAWNMTGSLLANLGPASDSLIDGLAWIDPVLLLIAFGLITWAFGWRVTCVALLFFGTNAPAIYFWTGGAYLRQDWFLWAMAGICFLKRGKPVLGGASLAVSALLRVFPAGFLVAIGLRLLWVLYRERRIDPAGARIVAGAALAIAILIPASSMVAGGFSAWSMFLKNTVKHAGTPLTNDMGLRTVLSFRWETRQKYSYDPRLVDPFHAYKEARREAFRGLFGMPLFLVLIGAYTLLVFRGVRREMEWWVLAAFGFGFITLCLELTCYYYSFLTAAALLGEKREGIPIGLLLLSAVTQMVVFATYFYDMRYTLESVVVIAFVLWATWRWARRPAGPAAPAASDSPKLEPSAA